ncbi:MAG: ferrochelatase [Alphaproteobacteria bacterium]|nr:ferrochelatase [Alphaproteobacteria bacterium]
MSKPRVAVVLFNLGGPDNQEAVQPFLFNLFNDPAIIGLPNPFRYFLAKLISSRRAPVAKHIYQEMGGGSPIVPLTEEQAAGLKKELSADWDVEVFISMRYWHPLNDDVALNVKAFAPDHIIALPLYPQFSTTTTASSFKDWKRAAKKHALDIPTTFVCCYPTESHFIKAHAELIRPYYEAAKAHGNPRILFSAHGLPEKTVAAGDPYQWQVEQTTQAVLKELNIPDVDYINTYQSRVGPLQWIKPATDEEIKRGGADGVPLVIVPIAFVSEHSETLVELDIEYGKLAAEHGVTHYGRVPALGSVQGYMTSLAKICRDSLHRTEIAPDTGKRLCPENYAKCPCLTESVAA